MTNRYQDFSNNYTHNLYTRNIKYTIKRHRQSNKKHTYSIVSGQFWQSTRHIVAGKIVECDGGIQLFKLRTIYQQYIISHKMFSILKIVHTRPDVSSRKLPPYSNSGKLLITDSFAHAYQPATATIQTIKLYRAHSTLYNINCGHAASRTCSHRHVTH